jgi:hypothetical protein
MTIDKIIVIIAAVLGIIGVYWFFLGKRPMDMTPEEHEAMGHTM